ARARAGQVRAGGVPQAQRWRADDREPVEPMSRQPPHRPQQPGTPRRSLSMPTDAGYRSMTAPTKVLILARAETSEDNAGSDASERGETRGCVCRPPSRHAGGGSVDSETQHLQELLDRWQAGDRAAADALCRRVARRFEVLARKMIGRFPNVRALADTDD